MKSARKKITKKEWARIGISFTVSVINILLVESLEEWTKDVCLPGLLLFRIVGTAAAAVAVYLFLRRADVRLAAYSLGLGVLMATAYVLGCRLRRDATALAGAGELPGLLLSIACLTVLAAACISPFLGGRRWRASGGGQCGGRKEADGCKSHKEYRAWQVFGFYMAVIFLAWLPVFLAYYPSVFAYDAEGQLYQVIAHDYSTHHPLIHTLFLGAFFKLGGMFGSYSLGMALHSVMQMLLMAAVFAYALLCLYKEKIPAVLRFLLLAFYAAFPTNSILALSTTKDVLFAALVLLYVLCLHKSVSAGKAAVAVAVLMLLFRNNAVYALLAEIPFVWFLLRKGKSQQRKKYLINTLAALLLFAVASAGLKAVTGADNGSPREMLSVPLQQMARVRVKQEERIEPKLREELEKYLPSEWVFAAYNPYLADPVKNRAIIHDDPAGLLKTWLRLFVKFPQTYIDAFLDNSVGYWFLEDTTHSRIYGIGTQSGFGYLSTDNRTMPAGCEIVRHSYLPGLRSFMEEIVSENAYQKIPVLSVIFAPAFYFWLLALYVTAKLYQKEYERVVPAVFLCTYYLTLLLSPTVLIRYMYPFVVSVPVLLCYLYDENRERENK